MPERVTRCPITDLLIEQCAHCQPKSAGPRPPLQDAPKIVFGAPSGSEYGPIVSAQYEGACQECYGRIDVGDEIRSYDLGWIHSDCAEE